MCDDWVHGGLPGDTWHASFTNLGAGNLGLLRYRQLPGALVLSDEAGWLLLQTRVTSPSQWKDINYAVWHIFAPNSPLSGTAPLYWLDLAQQEANIGFPSVDFYQVGIYTPINPFDPDPNGPQELLTISQNFPKAPVVPEPATFLLLGSGLAGLSERTRYFLRPAVQFVTSTRAVSTPPRLC